MATLEEAKQFLQQLRQQDKDKYNHWAAKVQQAMKMEVSLTVRTRHSQKAPTLPPQPQQLEQLESDPK